MVLLAGFLIGAAALASVNGFFSYTNELEFCTSCHSMQTNLTEYQETVHYKNASGVRAVCSDCHVPKQFGPKLHAKIMAVKDIYHELSGTVDTPEKYEARRWQLANAVWDRMKSTDSRECRSCHAFTSMDLAVQTSLAQKKHQKAQESGKTCIDCHKGIAHHEPLPPDEPAAAAATPPENTADPASKGGATQ
jgi:cytochrome c-type protein NapC